jgi:16S rRNA G1207 methylase RsmC
MLEKMAKVSEQRKKRIKKQINYKENSKFTSCIERKKSKVIFSLGKEKKGLSSNMSQVADEVDLLAQSMTIIYSLSAAVKQSNKQASLQHCKLYTLQSNKHPHCKQASLIQSNKHPHCKTFTSLAAYFSKPPTLTAFFPEVGTNLGI